MQYIILLFALLFLGAPTAQADMSCTFKDNGVASFGAVDSFTLASQQQKIASSSGFTCSGSTLVLLGTNTINARIGSTGSALVLTSTTNSDTIPYVVCKDSGCSQTYSAGATINWTITSLLGLLGLFNASDGTLQLYLQIPAGLNVAAGTYTSQLMIAWDYNLCVVGVVVCLSSVSGQKSVPVNITLNVTSYCYIDSAPDVIFAPAALVASFGDKSGSLSTRCTKNAAYTINLTSINAGSGNWRQMSFQDQNQVSHYLQYQFYQTSGSAWTANNNLSMSGSGMSQSSGYTVKINPAQSNQPAGAYSDTVTVTVTY